eukprot:233154-Pleurochrysis_carterae.AAC.1
MGVCQLTRHYVAVLHARASFNELALSTICCAITHPPSSSSEKLNRALALNRRVPAGQVPLFP